MQTGVSPGQHQIESVREERSTMRKLGRHRAVRQQLPKHLIVNADFKDLLPFIIIFIISAIVVALIP